MTKKPGLIKMLCRLIIIIFTFIVFCPNAIANAPAKLIAASLVDRLAQYPQWQNKPPVKVAQGDLYYPQWMAGTWSVESILTEQIAPLAPEIVTPGFQDNQRYINQPIKFLVRFGEQNSKPQKQLFFPKINNNNQPNLIVADRIFNGENIAAAYLGDSNVLQVKVAPDNPNKQITFLKGERKLISTVTGRASETPETYHFMTTELTKQLFKSPERIYLNEVETTSDYQLITPKEIIAQQITAIYLSPQDPAYFQSRDRPVAIYRYQLKLESRGVGEMGSRSRGSNEQLTMNN
jgi:hypothetical protein